MGFDEVKHLLNTLIVAKKQCIFYQVVFLKENLFCYICTKLIYKCMLYFNGFRKLKNNEYLSIFLIHAVFFFCVVCSTFSSNYNKV